MLNKNNLLAVALALSLLAGHVSKSVSHMKPEQGTLPRKSTPVKKNNLSARDAFVAWVKQIESEGDHWYIWGAQGPNYFDCSGLVCYGGAKVGLWSKTFDTTADGFWNDFPRTDQPQPGDLCLYGTKRRATHVTVYIGNGQQIGASGGGSRTTSVAKAKEQDARVKRHAVHYRKDFLGYVRIFDKK